MSITYTDKVDKIGSPFAEINKITAANMNEIKANINGIIDGQVKIIVVVQEAADLAGVLDATKDYLIDGIIDMGSTPIQVPATGIQLTGLGFNVSKLISSEPNYTMFTNGSAGDVLITGIGIEVTGASSKVFDLNNTAQGGLGAVELQTVNFNDCIDLGTLTGYRQFLANGCGWFGCSDGLKFDGVWIGGARITTSIVRGQLAGTIFKGEVGQTFASRLITDINIEIPAGVVGFDFAEANFINDREFQILGAVFSGSGTYLNDVDGDSIKSFFQNNTVLNGSTEVVNTFVGGQSISSADATTNILTQSIFEDLVLTTVGTRLVHFTEVNGVWTYLASTPITIELEAVFTFSGSNNNIIAVNLVHVDASNGNAETVIRTGRATLNGGGGSDRAENMPFIAQVDMEKDDVLKWQIANESSNSDIDTLEDSIVIIDLKG